MAEAVQAAAESTTGEIASFGKVRQSTFKVDGTTVTDILPQKEDKGATVPKADEGGVDLPPAPDAPVQNKKEGEAESQKAVVETKPESKSTEAQKENVEINDDLLKQYFEKNGIEFESMDALKSKLNPANEPTPEQIKKQEMAADKRKADIFVEGGGSIDDYVGIKEIANKPLAEHSKDQFKYDLLKKGLTVEEANEAINDLNSFYQVDEEELGDYDDETVEQMKRKKEAFSAVLENYAAATHKQAQGIIADLENEATERDRFAQEEEMITAKIDEHFTKLPRKLKVPMGESNGKPVSSVEYEISDSDIAEVHELLRDPSKRNQIFKTSDGELNVNFLADLLLAHKYRDSLAKTSFLEGQHRASQVVKETFGYNPYDLGIGGSADKKTYSEGKVASFGKVRRN